MDPVMLSRIQFGLAAGFHFIFPASTFGLTLLILILETLYLKSREEVYKDSSAFFVKILGLVFVMGIASGVVLEFAFGTNWAQYSRFVGDIFGVPLAAEGIFSFFLESVFMSILLFGRNKVSKKVYWLSAFLVFFGAHLSGLFILIANSWMQTPDGFKIEGGRAVLTSISHAALNHSTVIRFIHSIIAGWITGSLLAAGIGAWYLRRKLHVETAKVCLKIALIIFIITSLVQLLTGHSHSVQVGLTQPEKMAAYEALWQTTKGAPLSLFGIPDESRQKTYLFVGVPKMLSFLIHFNFNAKVAGLNEFPKDEQPPVLLPFASYHIMIGLGMLFIAISLLGAYLLMTKKIWDARWYLLVLICSIPFPYIANEFGWMATEIGRQPWAVYRVLKIANAASVSVPAWQILFSLIMFAVIYIFLLWVFIYVLVKLIKKGPGEVSEGY
ncbi:MAG: cytochrome ubiquinol oxidase subunit I [Firmicutes bacterium]|nr:cytochrome ubiquinol oxidase subunit I [Bacillota bacterium]